MPGRLLRSLRYVSMLMFAVAFVLRPKNLEAFVEYMFFTAEAFDPKRVPPPPDYERASSWVTSPFHTDRAKWVPVGSDEVREPHDFDVFWVHPTTYFLGNWNAPIDSFQAKLVTDFTPMREHAAVFNGRCRVFAPRYRQLSQGVQDRFSRAQQQAAMAVAYSDTWAAFQHFLKATKGRPFFVGSHSQGTLHSKRILQQWLKTAPAEEANRLVAWYGIGNTVPEAEMVGTLPVCQTPEQTKCYVSFNTALYGDKKGSNHWKKLGPPTCVNPLSWQQNEALVGKEAHLGAIPSTCSGGRTHAARGRDRPRELKRPMSHPCGSRKFARYAMEAIGGPHHRRVDGPAARHGAADGPVQGRHPLRFKPRQERDGRLQV